MQIQVDAYAECQRLRQVKIDDEWWGASRRLQLEKTEESQGTSSRRGLLDVSGGPFVYNPGGPHIPLVPLAYCSSKYSTSSRRALLHAGGKGVMTSAFLPPPPPPPTPPPTTTPPTPCQSITGSGDTTTPFATPCQHTDALDKTTIIQKIT